MKIFSPLLILLFSTISVLNVLAESKEIKVDRFEKEIQAFEKEDLEKTPPENSIVFVGSSSIRRWHSTIKEDLAPLTVIPRGFGGSTMKEALHYSDRIVIKYKPRAVVIYEGDNDIGSDIPPEKINQQFKEFIDKLHKNLPETRIYIISVKPSIARVKKWDKAQELNNLSKKLAAEDAKVFYIDTAASLLKADGTVMDDIFVKDNLHLNEKGTRIWAEVIKTALKDELKYEK